MSDYIPNNTPVDLNKYAAFADAVASDDGKYHEANIRRLNELNKYVAITRLQMAVSGLSSESGEAMEIVKKLVYQGKPWNEDVRFHLIRETSDIFWYLMQMCIALKIDPNAVINENVNKLQNRYPGGKFSVEASENRKEGDL